MQIRKRKFAKRKKQNALNKEKKLNKALPILE